MPEFAWPWLFLALPLPWLARRLLPPAQARQAALRVPFLEDFEELAAEGNGIGPGWGRRWLALVAWLLLVTAAARPQWQGEPVPLPLEGRDLMLAVDLSGSMAERDFTLGGQWVDRLTATKVVVSDFIERRKGDRIGLILFGDHAYLQAPLTHDRKTVERLLQEAFIKMAGQKTAIGDAIGLAVKRLRGKKGEKVLILVSDGENTAGEMDPIKAAQIAREEGLRIYTIGIGSESAMGPFGLAAGGGLDEETLKAIARITGGRYFRARDTRQLAQIYQEIDKLEPVAAEKRVYRPVKELFFWPLAAALLLSCGLLATFAGLGAGLAGRRENQPTKAAAGRMPEEEQS